MQWDDHRGSWQVKTSDACRRAHKPESGDYLLLCGSKVWTKQSREPTLGNWLCLQIVMLLFAHDATPSQLKSIGEAFDSALDSQAILLADVLPSLTNLMS